jgi:hypothetical protein
MKKALKFSMVMLLILLAGVFLVTSCSNPSDGRDGYDGIGYPGQNGVGVDGITWSTSLAPAQLAALFEESPKVYLISYGTNINVSGTIPEGKTLIINAGLDTFDDPYSVSIAAAGMTVEGTLEIRKNATLDAGTVASVGALTIEGNGSITGYGRIYLPVASNGSDFESVDYLSDKIADDVVKVAAAYTNIYTGSSAITAAEVRTIFDRGITNELTVENLTGIVSTTIPNSGSVSDGVINAGNVLTLLGSNTLGGAATVTFEPVGKLIVKGTLATASTVVTTIAPITDGEILIENGGRLTLTNAADNITLGGGVGTVTSNGTITVGSVTPTILQNLLNVPGEGTIVLTGTTTLTGSTALALTNHDLVIEGTLSAGGLTANPLFTGKKITIESGGVLNVGALAFDTVDFGVESENEGSVVSTATSEAGLKGLITKVDGDIGYGAVAALTGDLTILDGVNLEVGGILAGSGAFNVTVQDGASARFTAATFAGISGTITIDGDAEFQAILTSTGPINIGSTGNALFELATAPTGAIKVEGTATFSGAAVPAGNITVTGEDALLSFTGAAAPTGDISLENGAALATSGGGTLALASGKVLSISGAGTELQLAAAGNLTGASALVKATDGRVRIGAGPYADYTVTVGDTGIAPAALATAIGSLSTSVTTLTGAGSALGSTFIKGATLGVNAIGIATATDATTPKTIGVTLGAATTTIEPGYQVVTHKYSSNSLIEDIELSITTTAFYVLDGAWAGSSAKNGILTVKGLTLINAGVTAAVPDFNIGLTTSR